MKFEMTHALAIATLRGTAPSPSLIEFFENLGLGHFGGYDEWSWIGGDKAFEQFTIEELLSYAQMCIDSWKEE